MATDVIEIIQGPAPTIEVVTGAPGPVGPQGPPGPAAPSSSVFFYRVDANSTAATDPGAGKIRFNNLVQANATALYVDWLTEDDFDAHVFFKTSAAASQIVIQDADLADTYQVWKVTGIVESTDWFTVQMTFVSQSGPGGVATFPHNARVGVIIETVGVPGPPGPPGPAGTGDVVGPASATDNALAVFSGTTGKLVKDALGAAALGRINALAIGTNPAQSGSIRIPSTKEITSRNAANTADVNLVQTSGTDLVYVGFQSPGVVLPQTTVNPSLAIGTTPAQSGALRLANNQAITARNGANSADLPLVSTDTSNNVVFGSASAPSYFDGSSLQVRTSGVSYTFDPNGLYPAANNTRGLGHPNVRFATLNLGTAINLKEATASAAPAADCANLWLQDNGSGKSQLMIQFATGAPIAIATQA